MTLIYENGERVWCSHTTLTGTHICTIDSPGLVGPSVRRSLICLNVDTCDRVVIMLYTARRGSSGMRWIKLNQSATSRSVETGLTRPSSMLTIPHCICYLRCTFVIPCTCSQIDKLLAASIFGSIHYTEQEWTD